jgi:hypothetical protein
MLKLFKHLWAFVQVPFRSIPDGLWCGEPYDCVLSTFRQISPDGKSIIRYWHEPFVCHGDCKYGWTRGFVDFRFNEEKPTISFE